MTRRLPANHHRRRLGSRSVPDYFRLLGIPLQRGRLFDDHDGSGNPVVIVDRTWVRRFSPDRDPIGRTLREGGCTDCSNTIVGVVGDVRYGDLDQPDPGTVYWPVTERPTEHPIDQITSRFRYLVIRTAGDPAATIPSIRRVIHDLDPALPFTDVATIDELLDQSLVMPRYLSVLVVAFALVALLLSAIGIYGVMAYFVEQHSRDIGIRIALGGAPSMVSRMIVGQGMGVVGPGIALGLVVALGVHQVPVCHSLRGGSNRSYDFSRRINRHAGNRARRLSSPGSAGRDPRPRNDTPRGVARTAS